MLVQKEINSSGLINNRHKVCRSDGMSLSMKNMGVGLDLADLILSHW